MVHGTTKENSFTVKVNDRNVECVLPKRAKISKEARDKITDFISHYLLAEKAGTRPRHDGGVGRPKGIVIYNAADDPQAGMLPWLREDGGAEVEKTGKLTVNYHAEDICHGYHIRERLIRVKIRVAENGCIWCNFEYKSPTPPTAAQLRREQSMPHIMRFDMFPTPDLKRVVREAEQRLINERNKSVNSRSGFY